jgi:hypothetical protein
MALGEGRWTVLNLIHPGVLDRTETLAREFRSAKPFRHVVIDSFLAPDILARLIREFPEFDPGRAKNEMGETGLKATRPDLAALGGAYADFDRLMRAPQFLEWIGKVCGIERLLYDPEYAGGGTHENLDGQDLDFHVDFNYHPHRPVHRRLNLIVFLNPRWEDSWGGCLELVRDAWNECGPEDLRKVAPLVNRCVVFETTERSWHGFPKIRLPEEEHNISRRSIAVYFYTKARPEEETAAPHGTIYVPRPLPQHFTEGYTLTVEDRLELETLLARRDSQIRFLYEREQEYSRVLDGMLRSPTWRVGRMLTLPVKRLMRR